MSELLPCPFCGGEAHLVTGAPEHWVKCLSCNASSDTTSCSVRAASQWNKRHTASQKPHSEFIKCRNHKGDDCECGGSGWRRRCDKTHCHEHGCDGELYCYVSEQEAIEKGLSAAPKPEDV